MTTTKPQRLYSTGYYETIIGIIVAMKSDLWRALTAIGLFFLFCSCDSNFFGPDSRELAGGYGLKRVDDSNQIALTIPNKAGGIIIDEIGWREPFIIARASGSDYWESMDTAHAHRTSISDHQRRSDPHYQSIQTESAEAAWAKLSRSKLLW